MTIQFLMPEDLPIEKGESIHHLMEELYPLCRSITGDGVRQTLSIISKYIPIKINEVSSGTKAFDWDVPKEWNIKNAYIKDSNGEKIIDFAHSNLTVLNYSIPIQKKVNLTELKKHLYTIPEKPDWIPYRTSYFNETWGFCMPHNLFKNLKDEEYEVYIDSTLKNGSLSYGELFIEGQTKTEILVSTHICHPSLANDNLSGLAISTFLAQKLLEQDLKYSYRFVFIPGTIGSIVWLSLNKDRLHDIKYGLVIACVGDSGGFTYKKSRIGNASIDEVVEIVLQNQHMPYKIIDYFPYGYDERQYCSPGINLPMGCLMRTPHGEYPEYHTSADNLDFVKSNDLAISFQTLLAIFDVLEHDVTYTNLNPMCEPQLGKRGLYNLIGGKEDGKEFQLAMLWVLNYSDGSHSLSQICKKSGISFHRLSKAADILEAHKLLKPYNNN